MTGLPEHANLELAPDLRICRILSGMWQVSGGHGAIDPSLAIDAMVAHHDRGFTTWDLADHYGPAEDFIGQFRQYLTSTRGADALAQSVAFTKWVPNPGPMSRAVVERAVDVSLHRMQVDALDLLQFHWWDYADDRYLEALRQLDELRTTGKLQHLGLTNFDTARLEAIHQAGIRVVSNQVQYSLIDRRPEVHMAEWCLRHDVKLLAYGTLCGGLLSEHYFGRPEPRSGDLTTASLQKYKRMIDAWGGWDLFQELLRALKSLAEKHRVSIANVAVRAVLDQAAVGGVIVGVRLGRTDHLDDNSQVFDLQLDLDDRAAIDAVSAQSRDLYQIIGDCGDEYR